MKTYRNDNTDDETWNELLKVQNDFLGYCNDNGITYESTETDSADLIYGSIYYVEQNDEKGFATYGPDNCDIVAYILPDGIELTENHLTSDKAFKLYVMA